MSDVPKRCGRCGTENPHSAGFCSNCGTALAPASPPASIQAAPPGTPPAPAPAPIAPGPPAYAPIPSRSGGIPPWAIIGLVAGIAVIAAAVGIIVTRNEPTAVRPPEILASPVVPETTGSFSGQLDAYLPPEVTNCRHLEPAADIVQLGFPVIDAVNCEPPDPPLGGNVSVAFYFYADAATADAAYQTIVEVVGLTPESGDCASTNGVGPAETTWSGAGGQGRILCRPLPESGSALFWTSDGFPVLGGIVSRNPVADVYVYWQMLSDYNPPIDV